MSETRQSVSDYVGGGMSWSDTTKSCKTGRMPQSINHDPNGPT